VLRETTSRGLCELVCPSRTSERVCPLELSTRGGDGRRGGGGGGRRGTHTNMVGILLDVIGGWRARCGRGVTPH
jgi:hypothetical protein